MTKHQQLRNSYENAGLSYQNRNWQTLTPKTNKASWNIPTPIVYKGFGKKVINYQSYSKCQFAIIWSESEKQLAR